MALGILSVDVIDESRVLSLALLALALTAFVILGVRNFITTFRLPRSLTEGGSALNVAFVMFTLTAGCGVLADRLSTLSAAEAVLIALSVFGFGCGAVVFVVGLRSRRAAFPVDGRWLLMVVAIESIAINAAALAYHAAVPAAVAVGTWLFGLAAYGWIAALLVRRLASAKLRDNGITPDYWITMGALAISTVAADRVLSVSAAGLRNLVELGMLATWTCALVWIPLLVGLEVRRLRVSAHVPLRYDAMRWATVFPLGMFALATHEVATRFGIQELEPLSMLAFAAALLIAAFLGASIAVRGLALASAL